MITHAFLQGYWWLIISLLAGLLVFLMFVQGGQSFIFSLPRNDMQRKMMVNALGRKWEFTFTTLVTFGGAFFASFPLFYATSFGGAYWVWMAILFSFIIQAVAYEYRSKPANVYGTSLFDTFLFINGSVGPFLIGVAVATFFTGSDFTLDLFNRVTWGSGWHGLEALINPVNLLLGFAVLFLTRVLGLMYLSNTIDDAEMAVSIRKTLARNAVPFLIFFLAFVAVILTGKGFMSSPAGEVTLVKYHYLHNLVTNPLSLIFFAGGVVLVLVSLWLALFKNSDKAIWYAGFGTVPVVMALFFMAGYGDTAFYPSTADLQSSLTLENASSSLFTLRTMMYVSFIIPFVVAYIWYAWRSINRKRINSEEMTGDDHMY
ncbi:MAG: cytochrome d ubiquinol oxidase subunit II [Bacteroidales bacterium]|jgi:cytochrome d ubiquinol oxidase subunit II|nr:cytochrome d ubiquinol oxidase subunit II [Bacteroidales bacterium]